ncbi:MAG TPA: hypothetical protein VEI50_02570 [Nitrospiraceae bacterium]|nr:hypothetical protein [Nitrospiraceae bacterium]
MATIVKAPEAEFSISSQRGTPPRIFNRIVGTILAVDMTSHRTLHVVSDEGGFLELEMDRCACTCDFQRFLVPGHRVLVAFAASHVKLGPHQPKNPMNCNQWPGRVVLVDHRETRTIVIVKIRGQQITLKSLDGEEGFGRPLQVWDLVSVSIPPERLRLVPLGTGARLQRRLLIGCSD